MSGRFLRARWLLVLALAVPLAACRRGSRDGTAPPATTTSAAEVRAQAKGAVQALGLAAGVLSFCDAAGLHHVPLPGHAPSSVQARAEARSDEGPRPCPAGGLASTSGPEVTVRNPDHGPNDIVEVEGVAESFPLDGHAQDWASDSDGTVIVATANRVLRLDLATARAVELNPAGAARVAVGGGWVAWADGAAVVARPLAKTSPTGAPAPQVHLPRP